MKRFFFFFLALFVFPQRAFPWDEGFNFRDTLAYCTDPTDTQWAAADNGSAGAETLFPTTSGGVTFGFAGTPATDDRRDRNAALDCRLAGMNFYTNGAADYLEFTTTLATSGDKDVRLAIGDAGGTTARPQIRIYDNTTLLATIGTTSTLGVEEFLDATGVTRTSASDWVTNNATLTLTFSTTTFKMRVGRGDSSGGDTRIAHLRITDVAAPTPTPTPTASPSPTASPTPVPGTGGNVYPLLRRMKEQHD